MLHTRTIKKIPKPCLSCCSRNHDDYSLMIDNLPKAPPPPGRQMLELEPTEKGPTR